jgi:tRNA 2-thiouridine synthesizing protein A
MLVSARMCESDQEIDTTGLICPEPLMLVRNRIRGMHTGEVLRVRATDPSTERDLSNFCRFMNHAMLDMGQRDDEYYFVIRKGA